MTMLKKGSLTVTAEAQDGSKRKATVTIKAANLAEEVSITTKDGKNMVMGEDNIPVINLASGKSVNLKAAVQNASTTKVNWRVVMLNEKGEEMDAGAYAKISSSGKLSATKDLTSAKEVWVYAQPADGGSAEGKAKVVIRPLAQGVQIYTADQASGQMRTLADSRDAGIFGIARAATTMVWDMHPETNRTLQLAAKVYPCYKGDPSRNTLQSVTWTSSKPKVATIDTAGKITFHQVGTTTITATAADGSGKKVSFKLEVVKIMASLKLPEKAFIAGGKKLTLVPEITPVDTSWPHLACHVSDDTGRNDVTISSKGVLTTPKVTSPREVFVQAMSCDGSDLWTYCDVTIYPATTKVQLWNGEYNVTKLTMAPGETVNLRATCEPELAAGVYQWTSSNEKYATVDQNGKVIIADTAVSGKKVTITCMADDGTKVKASVTITVEAE